jgi:hypothetical protein
MASTYLTRTFGTAGNRRTFTISYWVKMSYVSTTADQAIMGAAQDGSNSDDLYIHTGRLNFSGYYGGTQYIVRTSAKYRDLSGWYHHVIRFDTTQATASDRLRLYVNGELQTALDNNTYPSLNFETTYFNTARQHTIGSIAYSTPNMAFNGSMSHFHFCDGYSYGADSFGEYDANGVWTIKTSPSVTYGTNGFFILKNGNSVTDQSGNGNNFTVAGGTLTKTEDNPSNVFATFNPLARNASNTYANGNTTYDYSNNYQKSTVSTLSTNNVKIYSEFKILRNTTMHLGIAGNTYISDGRTVTDTSASHTYDIRGHTGTIVLQTVGGNANIYADGSDTGSDVDFTTTTNDIVMIAFDPTTKKIWWGKNGTWSNSGDPSNGTNPSYTYSGTATSDFCFAVASENSSAGGISANFGNGYFGTTAVASAGTNASGIGIFEYDVPTGYTALSTKGLNL